MNSTDLLRVAKAHAEGAVNPGAGRPLQAELKRAVSTTYYALFLHLCATVASLLVGNPRSDRERRVFWRRMYRVLEHGATRNKCGRRKEMDKFTDSVQDFANLLVWAQGERHNADYDPYSKYTRRQALDLIAKAGVIIEAFDATPRNARLDFITYLLENDRNRRR